MEVSIVPVTWRREPRRKMGWKWPASVRRPENVPREKRRKTWVEPIQEMEEGVWWRVVV